MPPLSNAISRRLFVHVGGYDPKTPEAFFTRLDKELGRYETTWNVETARGPIEEVSDGLSRSAVTSSGVSKEGPWQVETDTVFLSLEDIVQHDFADPATTRARRYAKAFADYWTSGTAPKFFRHAWRFSLYFLYPAVALVAGFALLFAACALPAWLAIEFFSDPSGYLIAGIALVASILLWPIFLRWWGKRKYILHLADLWSFSSAWLHRRRPDADRIFTRYGETVARLASEQEYDEIVLLGHSTGGAIILHVAAQAFHADPAFASRAPHVTVATVGSTALKIGLHPEAAWFREEVRTLHEAGLEWVEFQSIQDIINFEGTDPAALMNIRTSRPWPVAHRVRMKRMLEPATWKRIRRNVFRVHYQFVFANTLRFAYDYPSVAFGPVSLAARAAHFPRAVRFLEGEA